MANIPGINGFVQPGVFVRDRVISRGASIPGGTRIACIMGEGLREETIVDSALGSGLDGSSDCSPTGTGDGRYFKLSLFPVAEARTELYLNGALLTGIEGFIDESSFDSKYNFKIDPETGCIELQGASIVDQNGKLYSASTSNTGNGTIVTAECGGKSALQILDKNAPTETWTFKVVNVVRDSSGNPIPGKATFTATGSVSGQLKDSNGNPYLFHSSYLEFSGAISSNQNLATEGYVVATEAGFSQGSAFLDSTDFTTDTTNKFIFDGDLISQGQALSGDYLILDGYSELYEIEDIEYNSEDDVTTITVASDSIDTVIEDVDWKIVATNLIVDGYDVEHDPTTGEPDTAGDFTSADVGKVLDFCDGIGAGLYRVTAVTSSRRLRIESFVSTDSMPTLYEDFQPGLAEGGATMRLVETNGILLVGIQEGSTPFIVGDKFTVKIQSNALRKNDRLEARYIALEDLNAPELFTSAVELYQRHGRESVTNTLSLGARLAFENGAPAVLAMQCKPAIPRRTSETLFIEGAQGYNACNGIIADCDFDDLVVRIPNTGIGLRAGRPDGDTGVNFFVTRNGKEKQIFPNKAPFYQTALANPIAGLNWATDPDNAFSYTVIREPFDFILSAVDGTVTGGQALLTSISSNFDAYLANGDYKVLITSVTINGDVYTSASDIQTELDIPSVFLSIESIINDNTLELDQVFDIDAEDIQFSVLNDAVDDNISDAYILFHKDLISSGTLKTGDGIRISYIDEKDAEFFDTNWFEAYETLEAYDLDIIVPLPTQNRSGIFQTGVQHCQVMSSINIQKDRFVYFGAPNGLTPDALLGLKELALEDVGVLEGIQGDDPAEVLDGDTEDLVNYKLNDNFTTLYSTYFYPDQIIRNINGSNTAIDGFYQAAAAAGWLSATQNLAIPLTNKVLTGFTIPNSRKFRPTILNALGNVGATVLQPITGGGKVLAGRTTSNSGYVEDEEISITFIRKRVKDALRSGMQSYIGSPENPNTLGVLTTRANTIMSALVSQELITNFSNVRVERDKVDPRQFNVYGRYQPSYPLNFIMVDLEVGIV